MGMLQALIASIRRPDLRNKILFTVGMIIVFRFLAHVPLPGVNEAQLQTLLQNNQLLNLLDLFSGGGLARFSVVALGVNPYINASIIMTLLNQTIPALERLSKEGEYGRNRINQYTRILTVPLALLQGIGVAVFMQRQGVLNAFGPSDLGLTLSILASLTAGTIILMWLGELISERGIGNGISFIIFAGIVGRLPNTVQQTLEVQQNYLALGAIAVIAIAVIAAIIFIQEGQRRIPVQYAKRVRGTRMYSGGSTHIQRTGGFTPGIRPGRPTAEFLGRVVTRITIAGALFLGIVAVMPTLIGDITQVQTLRLGGTSILIVVGVVVETMKQLEAQLLQRSYEGFIR